MLRRDDWISTKAVVTDVDCDLFGECGRIVAVGKRSLRIRIRFNEYDFGYGQIKRLL